MRLKHPCIFSPIVVINSVMDPGKSGAPLAKLDFILLFSLKQSGRWGEGGQLSQPFQFL